MTNIVQWIGSWFFNVLIVQSKLKRRELLLKREEYKINLKASSNLEV